jgi:Tol biopolymer transport system component
LLVGDLGEANHGIGPVWSPTGDRIAYQTLIPDGGEGHEVVLVNVADGTQRTIAPLVTHGSKRFRADRSVHSHWLPFAVWWSPDGTTLLYAAWSDAGPGYSGPVWSGLLAVSANRPNHATVLIASGIERDLVPSGTSHQWPIQMWGRQPE